MFKPGYRTNCLGRLAGCLGALGLALVVSAAMSGEANAGIFRFLFSGDRAQGDGYPGANAYGGQEVYRPWQAEPGYAQPAPAAPLQRTYDGQAYDGAARQGHGTEAQYPAQATDPRTYQGHYNDGRSYGGQTVDQPRTGSRNGRAERRPAFEDQAPRQDARAWDDVTSRLLVAFDRRYAPGTIIVSFADRYLYYVQEPGQALRYLIGTPAGNAKWSGELTVSDKQVNPRWIPTADMRKEDPSLPPEVPGGHPRNPLGTRALYLGETTYRIHGTDAPWTVGQEVSHGCIRLYNRDILDLYQRVPIGAKVIVTWQSFSRTASLPPVGEPARAAASAAHGGWQTTTRSAYVSTQR